MIETTFEEETEFQEALKAFFDENPIMYVLSFIIYCLLIISFS
jgi:hypothetical protein